MPVPSTKPPNPGDPGDPAEDFRCAVWTSAQGFDPIGSATMFDRLIVVEVPPPWPADVADMTWIAPLDIPDGTRVQAAAPATGPVDRDPDGSVLITGWERAGARLVGVDWRVPVDQVPGALAALVAGDEPPVPGGFGHVPSSRVGAAPAEILVCGHGARDRCCGGAGTRLAIAAQARLPEYRVRRTSHLGGHRFAPTALTLPDGRMWAHLDADSITAIARRTTTPAQTRARYRGNVALDPWAQVVEGEVLAHSDWDDVDFDDLASTSTAADDRADVALTWTAHGVTGERQATVEVAARYPVLQCGLAPSAAKKSSAEYQIVTTSGR